MKRVVILAVILFMVLGRTMVCAAGDIYTEGTLEYRIEDGGIVITGYFGDGGAIVIPQEIAGLPVSELAEGAFTGAPVTEVTVPGTMMKISENAVPPSCRIILAGEGVEEDRNVGTEEDLSWTAKNEEEGRKEEPESEGYIRDGKREKEGEGNDSPSSDGISVTEAEIVLEEPPVGARSMQPDNVAVHPGSQASEDTQGVNGKAESGEAENIDDRSLTYSESGVPAAGNGEEFTGRADAASGLHEKSQTEEKKSSPAAAIGISCVAAAIAAVYAAAIFINKRRKDRNEDKKG